MSTPNSADPTMEAIGNAVDLGRAGDTETARRDLAWDIRAIDAADALTDERVQQYHASLQVAGFYPSLYLNLADNFRRLGAFAAAADHINGAAQHAPALPAGPYGDMIRTAISEVHQAIADRDTTRRTSSPDTSR